jgi:hypothetical protein
MIDKLPKRVFIGLYEFKVAPVDPGDVLLHNDADPEMVCEGMTHTDISVIAIDKTLTLKRLVNVVLHECTHSINWSGDLTDESTEEEFTENFANGFTQFWLDNPRMVLWLNRAFKQIRKEQAGE